jgi:integrase
LIEQAMRKVRGKIEGLPVAFSFHDLRHYLASLLIASGADIKMVQARMRHASATTMLDTYGHPWPDADESTRIAIGAVNRGADENYYGPTADHEHLSATFIEVRRPVALA